MRENEGERRKERKKLFKLSNVIPRDESMPPTLPCLFINDLIDKFHPNEATADVMIIVEMKVATMISWKNIVAKRG